MMFSEMTPRVLTAQREWHTINPLSKMAHNSNWVVRDANGTWIDADQFRNDLTSRYPGLKLIGS